MNLVARISLLILLVSASAAGPAIWFEDVRHSPSLPDEALRPVTAYVRHHLLQTNQNKTPDSQSPARKEKSDAARAANSQNPASTNDVAAPADSAPLLPKSAVDDFFPRIVFISVGDGVRPARVAIGSARGVLKAADQALALLNQQLNAEQSAQAGASRAAQAGASRSVQPGKGPRAGSVLAFEPRWIKVDVVDTILFLEGVDFTRKLEFERSLFGLAFPRATPTALLPEELVAGDVISYHQLPYVERLLEYVSRNRGAFSGPTVAAPAPVAGDADKPAAPARLIDDPRSVDVFRFTTRSYFADRDRIEPLYRGHRLFKRIDRDELDASIRAAARYLTNAVSRDGRFDYIYQPELNKQVDDYNLVRHYGTIIALLEAYQELKDPDLLAAAKRAFGYGELSLGQWTQGGEKVPCVIDARIVSLGGNALAAVAYAKYLEVTGDKKELDRLRGLGRAIIASMREDGSFVHYQRFPDGLVLTDECEFFPGEAVLALLRINQVDPHPQWLDAAERAAKHLILVRDKDATLLKLPHDHWLLYSLNELYRARKHELYLAHELKLAEAVWRTQQRAPKYTDWTGGYSTPPGSTPAAVRTEGLMAAYLLFRDHGRRDDAADALEAAVYGVTFQLQCQFRGENAMYFQDPARCLGAFRESLTSANIRMDFVQHHLLGILTLYRVMKEEGITSLALPREDRRKEVEGIEIDPTKLQFD